jgi:hypothetical protein
MSGLFVQTVLLAMMTFANRSPITKASFSDSGGGGFIRLPVNAGEASGDIFSCGFPWRTSRQGNGW